jgi:hypothetical protein
MADAAEPALQYANAAIDQSALLSMGHAASTTQATATGLIYQTYRTQASVLAYAQVFELCAVAAFCIVPVAMLFSNYKPGPGAKPAAGHSASRAGGVVRSTLFA